MKLFIPSVKEMERYFPNPSQRVAMLNRLCMDYWLRDGGRPHCVIFVDTKGQINYHGQIVTEYDMGVRPMLKLEQSIFATIPRSRNEILFGKWSNHAIRWHVIDEQTGLCMARDCLFRHPFDRTSNQFEESDINRYLNDTVLERMFPNEEQKHILSVELEDVCMLI